MGRATTASKGALRVTAPARRDRATTPSTLPFVLAITIAPDRRRRRCRNCATELGACAATRVLTSVAATDALPNSIKAEDTATTVLVLGCVNVNTLANFSFFLPPHLLFIRIIIRTWWTWCAKNFFKGIYKCINCSWFFVQTADRMNTMLDPHRQKAI